MVKKGGHRPGNAGALNPPNSNSMSTESIQKAIWPFLPEPHEATCQMVASLYRVKSETVRRVVTGELNRPKLMYAYIKIELTRLSLADGCT